MQPKVCLLTFENPNFVSDHSCIFMTRCSVWLMEMGGLPLWGCVLAGQVMERQGSVVRFLLISEVVMSPKELLFHSET